MSEIEAHQARGNAGRRRTEQAADRSQPARRPASWLTLSIVALAGMFLGILPNLTRDHMGAFGLMIYGGLLFGALGSR